MSGTGPLPASREQLENEHARMWDAARICLERLEKPLLELERLSQEAGELHARLERVERMLDRAAGELRRIVR